uniref:Uncharacterized protein n=1 Tax=Fagus sylvatica TaxID=28930 RepID=A0A2N9HMC9_FAGSY
MESGAASATLVKASATQAETPISKPKSTCTQHVGSTPDKPPLPPKGKNQLVLVGKFHQLGIILIK